MVVKTALALKLFVLRYIRTVKHRWLFSNNKAYGNQSVGREWLDLLFAFAFMPSFFPEKTASVHIYATIERIEYILYGKEKK